MLNVEFCLRQFVLFLFVILLSGCAASNSYLRIRYSPTYLKIKIDQIAILPFSQKYLSTEEKEEIDEILSKSITSMGEFKFSVTSCRQTDSLLNKINMTRKSEDFWDDFVKNGIINKEFLSDIKDTLNIKYLLKGEILKKHTQDNVYKKIIGYTEVDVKFVLFSTTSQNLVWEVNIAGKKHSPNTIFYPLPSTMEALEIALDRFMHEFPLFVL